MSSTARVVMIGQTKKTPATAMNTATMGNVFKPNALLVLPIALENVSISRTIAAIAGLVEKLARQAKFAETAVAQFPAPKPKPPVKAVVSMSKPIAITVVAANKSVLPERFVMLEAVCCRAPKDKPFAKAIVLIYKPTVAIAGLVEKLVPRGNSATMEPVKFLAPPDKRIVAVSASICKQPELTVVPVEKPAMQAKSVSVDNVLHLARKTHPPFAKAPVSTRKPTTIIAGAVGSNAQEANNV